MQSLVQSELPFIFSGDAAKYELYPKSVNRFGENWIFMARVDGIDALIVIGPVSAEYEGERFENAGVTCVKAPLDAHNALMLRRHFPFTAPVPVLNKARTIGLGDRLGIAAPGHIRVMEAYDAYPVFAQQSIRELTLTGRNFVQVLDCVTFAVFREGFRRGFGADGDHLKKPEEVEYALRMGCSMITLDCSEYIRNDIEGMSDVMVDTACAIDQDMRALYLNKTFQISPDTSLNFDEDTLKRCILIYGKALDFATSIYQTYIQGSGLDFEISIDETQTPTLPVQHFFVANELYRRKVIYQTVAPRFCGEFQKGIDYIGDIKQFEEELRVHVAIADYFGYKLSIHSGSDKFAVFQIIGKLTRGRFHVKTAGTNWLVAMQVIAEVDPALYREVHKFALMRFEDAKKYYHVTTDIGNIPNVDTLTDAQLPGLFALNDVRQLIHITYGFILTEKEQGGKYIYRDRLYRLWDNNRELYAQRLADHIGRHCSLLYSGWKN